ncbi:SIR2 family protein [Chryseobacterium wanjuense]|nr:SIR2 family protein [Chryseobacterium wanjuense]
MNKKFLADIQIIKNAINTNKLVIFAGAGISIDANVPSWSSLIDKIKDELDLPDDEKDYLKIAQIYFNDRQEKEYIEKVRASLGHKKLRYNEIHEELFELNPEHILTTNFEDLLEQVITKNSLPYSIIREDKDLPYSNNTKLLVKIHGDLDTGNLVFKEDDYLGYSQNHPLLDSFIKSVFSTKVVLFIGYSFNDYNLKQIVQYVRNILGNNFQNAYLLSIDKEVHQSHRQYLKNKGINVINYFDANYIEQKDGESISKNYIDDFLKEDNIYGKKSNYLKEVKSLSEKGQLLLNFLRFLRFYDKLKISINEENVVDQIYNSLIRFEEVKSLPQDFISKLYPFKSTLEHEHLIEYNALLLKNTILADLFFDKIEIEGSEIILTDTDSKKKKKIEFILKALNNGLIFYVTKENEKPDSLGYKGFSDVSKNINYKSVKKCTCSKCKYEKYQLKESLTETNSYSISDTTDITEDMQKAFLNYKFGNYFQSFKMFEEVASKAWITQKFITYYIAKTNMKALRTLINWEFQIDDKEKESAIEKIDDIDIDKLIFHIPNKSDDEYNLLKIIRDDKVLTKVKDKIDNYYDEILKTYKLFQNKYSNSVGPYYPQLIYFELFKLLVFYNENYIINDEFSDFKNIINKAVEALMINYSTDNRYGGKIKEFDVDFFGLTIPYINTDRFVKVLEEYDIEEIKFKKDNLGMILSYSNNFLKSYFEEGNIWGIESRSEIMESQLQKSSFEERTRKIFSNIMVFLSLIELNSEQFDSIKSNILLFLSFNIKLSHNNIKYLKWFLYKNYKSIKIEDCKRLLEISCRDTYNRVKHDILNLVAEICSTNQYVIIDDIEYAQKLLSDFEYLDKHSDNIIYLWVISNDKVKNFYYQIITERLQNNFDNDLYRSATLNKIIDYNIFFDSFISYLNKRNKGNDSEKDGYFMENGKPKFHNHLFYNDLLFFYRLGVKENDQRLQKLSNLYEFMKFCIFREKYDFSKFKVEWLYLFDHKIFYNEFKKIKPLKKIIETALKAKYDEELAKIYAQFFI